MKSLIAITAVLMTVSFGNAQAAPLHLEPLGASFSGTGKLSAVKNGSKIQCEATLKGHIDGNGVGFVDSGSLTDRSGSKGCKSAALKNLPWKITASTRQVGVIKGVSFTMSGGTCGAGDIRAKFSHGTIRFNAAPLPPDCAVSAKISTHPEVEIED